MDFYFVVWAPLLSDRANTIMILKTCAALGRRAPDWRFHLRCAALPVEPVRLAETLGVELPSNLDIAPMFDTRGMEEREAETRIAEALSDKRSARRRSDVERWRREWKRALAGRKGVIYVRNIGLLTFFREELGDACPPLFLELHQLKHRGQALSERVARTLGELKGALKETRARELDLLRKARAVFCISQSMRDQIAAMAPDMDLEVLPSGTDIPPDDVQPPSQSERDLDILYVGQLYPWKGVHTIIEALRFTRKPWRLTVVGGNDPADRYLLAKLAENWGLSDRIEWLGQKPQREVFAYQSRAKVGVVPLPWSPPISRWYTSPIKVIELMMAGACILGSDVPALRGLLEDGRSARTARAGDPRDWAAKLDQLLEDEPGRAALAANARARARELTYDRRADRILRGVQERI